MKKLIKFCMAVLMAAAMIIITSTSAFASTFETTISYAGASTTEDCIRVAGISDIINPAKEFIDHGKGTTNITPDSLFSTYDGLISIGQVLVAIGIATLVIVTLIMAIKWITAKPEQQAKLQQQLIGLVVAAVVLFGAVGIWNLVRGIMEGVEQRLGGSTNSISTVYVAKVDSEYRA